MGWALAAVGSVWLKMMKKGAFDEDRAPKGIAVCEVLP